MASFVEARTAAGPGFPEPPSARRPHVATPRSKASPHVSRIQNCASSGLVTAATGTREERRTGESVEPIVTPWNGLSAPPRRSSQRPSHPGTWSWVIRPVSQKWREWKCERSGLA